MDSNPSFHARIADGTRRWHCTAAAVRRKWNRAAAPLHIDLKGVRRLSLRANQYEPQRRLDLPLASNTRTDRG
jgi:hypothetical protein